MFIRTSESLINFLAKWPINRAPVNASIFAYLSYIQIHFEEYHQLHNTLLVPLYMASNNKTNN